MATAPSLSIAGTVTDSTGSPLPGITMTLTSPTESTQTSTTAPDGTFSLAGLSKGTDYVVTPTSPGYAFDPPTHQYVPLQASVTHSTYVGTQLSITGRTLQTGSAYTPVGGCLVQLVDIDDNSQVTTTDPITGRYAFKSGLQGGHSYTLQASKDGWTPVFDAQQVDALSTAVERDIFLTADPHESVVTTWLLPVLGIVSPTGLAALGFAIYAYLKPTLPPQAGAPEVEAALANVNVGQAVDAGIANNVLAPADAAAVRAAANLELPLSEIPAEVAGDLVGNAQQQVTTNVANNLVAVLSDAGSTDPEVVQTVTSIGSEEVPAVMEALTTIAKDPDIIARLKALFDTCVDVPEVVPAEAQVVAVGESGWSGAIVEAATSGVGVTVDINELGLMLPLTADTVEISGVAVEGVFDLLVGAIVCVA